MSNLKRRIFEKLKSKGYEDHSLPVTRRDLIKLGLMAGGGALVPMSAVQRAIAATNKAPHIPFLVFDLAGGAGLPANFLVGQKGGPEDLCVDYGFHGWNPRASDSLDKTFGLPMAKKESKILAGIRQHLPQEIKSSENQAMIKMASFAHFSLNDTSSNFSSALHLIARSGAQGSVNLAGLSLQPTMSGGNSQAVGANSLFRPKLVTNVQEVVDLPSFGQAYADLPGKTRREIFDRLKGFALNDSLLKGLYEELSKSGLPDQKLDPRNSAVSSIYNMQDPANVLEAAIVYNVLMGNTGPGVITIGNCDYHNNTQTLGDSVDMIIGESVGRAIAAAHALKKPLFFQIITDGGVTARDSKNYERVWTADQNLHTLSVMGYFDPLKTVNLRKQQIAYYTPKGEVDAELELSKSTDKMVLATVLNYLHLSNRVGEIEKVMGNRVAANGIDDLLVFA